MDRIKDGKAMVAGMTPELQPGEFVFCSTGDAGFIAAALPEALGSFREREGLSLLLPVGIAEAHGQAIDQPMRQITLNVYSDLEGVGLTAAVAGHLADCGIACNMVAATHHDHVFVPSAEADRALGALRDLQTVTAEALAQER